MNALIIEDEMIIGIDLELKLNRLGVKNRGIARNLEQALTLMNPEVQLVFLDINLDGKEDGIEVAEILRRNHAFYAVFISGSMNQSTIERALSIGKSEYIKKPFNEVSIQEAILRAENLMSLEQS